MRYCKSLSGIVGVLMWCAGALAQVQPGSPAVIDASTLTGKVICGYQGWFNAPADGASRGWVHWGRGAVRAGMVTVDLLPDMTELEPDERFATDFRFPDGSALEVFSSYNAKTVNRHFRWMREYGIDGVFLQRFATGLGNPAVMRQYDQVLKNVMAGARENGRVFGIMYDLSGLAETQVDRVIGDFKHLRDQFRMTGDARYIRDGGKPVVALWGYGFGDGRDPLIGAGGLRLIQFLQTDPTYGGNRVMVGLPTGWRTFDGDAVKDPAVLKVAEAADIISPWTVGRYSTIEQVDAHAAKNWSMDIDWCKAHQKQYMPVVFPGFSWHNLRSGRSPLNQIPRQGGRFLWSQFTAARNVGATMIYTAMFDEVDEGTAIFKCTNTVPAREGTTEFLTYEGLPSDFYLRLVGQGTRLLRGEIRASDENLINRASPMTPVPVAR